jgi:hypothetical protein
MQVGSIPPSSTRFSARLAWQTGCESVDAAADRFRGAGLHHALTEAYRCCHAAQDKVWVAAPDVPLGAWEFYTVLADDPGEIEAAEPSTCCTKPTADASGPCCGSEA